MHNFRWTALYVDAKINKSIDDYSIRQTFLEEKIFDIEYLITIDDFRIPDFLKVKWQ